MTAIQEVIDTRRKWYVGISDLGVKRETFTSYSEPTEKSHGHKYAAVIGPFRTKRGAEYMAKYGRNNPHLQHVDDAERLAAKEDRTGTWL